MKFTAKIKNGKILPIERALFWDSIPEFEGKEVQVNLELINTRSNPQNRYYWGVIISMIHKRLDELGYTRADLFQDSLESKLSRVDVHEFLKKNFNRSQIINKETGAVLGSSAQTTKKLKTKDFSNYLEHIKRWAVEHLSINIPDPQEIEKTVE